MAKKTVKKKQSYWANLYTLAGDNTVIMVQGNTFKSKAEAERNVYPEWVYVGAKLIFKK